MQVLFFDGQCLLCNNSVKWLLKHKLDSNIRLATLDSDLAYQHLSSIENYGKSVVFLNNDSVFIKSDAVFEVLKYVPGYSLLRIFRFIPLKWQNKIYDWIAGNRYQWFGKTESCILPNEIYSDR